ncbi:MAG: UbiA prenyltransferase family protein [Deltaproteobacteria bacterium]|nr:UbiA prenyltransferase family protein [Deltaproteobacteria bacterium]
MSAASQPDGSRAASIDDGADASNPAVGQAREVAMSSGHDNRVARLVVDHWRALRPAEVLLMTAFPMAGFVLGRPSRLALADVPDLAWTLIASFCIAGAAYVYNSLEGLHGDRHNDRVADHPLVSGRVTEPVMRVLMGALAVFGVAGFAHFGTMAVWSSVAVLAAGFFYSNRWYRGKERPGIASVLHFVGATAFYAAGAGARITQPTPLVGAVLLGILFVTGHLHHEVVDHEADTRAGLKTLAVRHGVERSIWLGTAGFAVFYVVNAAAWLAGWWPGSLAIPFVAGGALHAGALAVWAKRGLQRKGAYAYRTIYRSIFLGTAAVAGLAYLIFGF